MQLQQINEVFGISLSAIEHSAHNSNIQLNSGIYQNVLSKIENQYGSKFLKFDISPENYMKYKNGKTSSIIKSDTGGIQEHVGFEAVEMVNLVDSIFTEVDRYYTTKIMIEFNEAWAKVKTSLLDHKLDRKEKNETLTEIAEAIKELQQLQHDVEYIPVKE